MERTCLVFLVPHKTDTSFVTGSTQYLGYPYTHNPLVQSIFVLSTEVPDVF